MACGYSYNLDVAGKRLSEIQDPVGTVLFHESTLGAMDAADTGQSQPRPGRHAGANNKAYVDGHASGRTLQPEKLPPPVLAPVPRQTK